MLVKLNNYKYRYDVYQIINIFFNNEDIKFSNENYDIDVNIEENKIYCKYKEFFNEYNVDSKIKFKDNIKKAIFLFLKEITKKELPWGTLVGIRPSKIALDLIKKGYSDNDIIEYFQYNHCTRKDKINLCINIAKNEANFVNKSKDNISIYIDMPFCPTRCLYCSFASNPIDKNFKLVDDYLEALFYEMDIISNYIKEKKLNIECVYFGGGTPTSLDDYRFRKVMEKIFNSFIKNNENIKEFNVECGRPDSLNYNKFNTMKDYNVNRISINPQTMNDESLKLIGRKHSSEDIRNIFYMAKDMGFSNINMDIIVGLPGENLKSIQNTCLEIKKLNPDNLTVHGLSIKRGSLLYENIINNKKYNVAHQNELNEMFEETYKLSKELGMYPYYMYRQKNMLGNMENIGYCKEQKEGIYNIEMIEERQTIIALGADAVSKIIFLDENRIERFANLKDVKEYINRIDEKLNKKINLLNVLYK